MKKIFWLLLFVLSLFSCKKSEEDQSKPNILWITNEDTGPAFGCYGDTYAMTPNIDKLADQGYVFTRAFSNAPICAPARSTLITGMYATSLGTQHLRSKIPVPSDLKILPELMREAGYYTTNNAKTDYNFSPEGRWDENGNDAHWRHAPEGKPFFSVFNFGITHEGNTNYIKPEDTESLEKFHDPEKAILPPYFPDTPEYRKIWAHMYDLISVFDQGVGDLIQQLKDDGKLDNTIIFIFSDHGFGLLRYKRWMYNSGIRVPFVLYVPEKYKSLVSNLTAHKPDQMVGFVDFAPTVLKLTGVEPPPGMEGHNFLGKDATPNQYIFGYRDRADDCYDMSRLIYNGKYEYIRNFMPHKPYIQNAIIFNEGKAGNEEMFRVKAEGKLPPEAGDMFKPKPVEELYNLEVDPFELDNLIGNPGMSQITGELREKLHGWMVKYKDTGLLNEGEMIVKAEGKGSVYEMTHDSSTFNAAKILEAAELTGKINHIQDLDPYLKSGDSGVRYWALVAMDGYTGDISSRKNILIKMLQDSSPVVRTLAAEILIKHFNDTAALATLKEIVQSDIPQVALQAAISIRNIGDKAKPLVPFIQQEMVPQYTGNVWNRYKSWMYPMFIGFALDQAMINSGVDLKIRN